MAIAGGLLIVVVAGLLLSGCGDEWDAAYDDPRFAAPEVHQCAHRFGGFDGDGLATAFCHEPDLCCHADGYCRPPSDGALACVCNVYGDHDGSCFVAGPDHEWPDEARGR
jgi:hypothetical protein